MKPILILYLFLLPIILINSTEISSYNAGGAQIIDSKLSFMYNLRYVETSFRFWVRADKSSPNVFNVFDPLVSDNGVYKLQDESPLSGSSSPFLGFDVVSYKGVDYVVGSTYGNNQNKAEVGLPLQISSSEGKGTVDPINFPDFFLYTPTINTASLTEDGVVIFYISGWKHSVDKSKAGLVLVQASANLVSNTIIFDTTNDVLFLNQICYDIFTELNKPHIYIQDNNVIVAVPGHCSAFYKVEIPSGTPFSGQTLQSHKVSELNQGVVGTTYSTNSGTLYYALKNYNTAQVTIMSFNTSSWKKGISEKSLSTNETSPVIAVDSQTDDLFIATTGFDRVLRWKSTENGFEQTGIATLPPDLIHVSSMLHNKGHLYIVTNEPDAQIGRISDDYFCDRHCGRNAFCADKKTNLCSCASGYALPPDSTDTSECAPQHEVTIIINTINEAAVGIVFLVLFIISLIGGIIGWVLWWRVRTQAFQRLLDE